MSVDVVAVGTQPIVWAVYCEECDVFFGEPTTDGKIADVTQLEHEKWHENI